MKRIHVVYSLVLDETRTKVLMVKNEDNGRWSFPGGEVEGNEYLETAAVREAKEETGLDIRVCGIVAINEAILEAHQEHALFVTFRAEIVGGQPEISRPDEIGDIQWISLEQADELFPYYKEGISGLVKKDVEVTYFNEGTV